ncbi:unnamed protein product [Pylaiella littoralis]
MGRKKVAEVVVGPSGVDLWRLEEPTLWYIVGLLALHVVTREVFKRYGPFKSDAALFAHQVCSVVCIAHCAFWGIYYWFAEAGTVEDRLYGPTVGAVVIGQVNLAFQFYDLLATVFVARLCKAEMVVHHTLATLMAYFLMRDCYVHYYAIFFLGISEVSSVPLVFVDLFKYFPDFAARFPDANHMLRISFALVFLVVRVFYWPIIAGRHLWDTFRSVQAGTVHNVGVVSFFTVCNLTLTLMQWYWGYLIIRAATKMLSVGSSSSSGDGAKDRDSKPKKQ